MAALGCAQRTYVEELDLSSPLPFELTAAALGLLLVFRTNSSYSRWVRAQDSMASIIARSHELIYLTYNIKDEELRMQVRWSPFACTNCTHSYSLQSRL